MKIFSNATSIKGEFIDIQYVTIKFDSDNNELGVSFEIPTLSIATVMNSESSTIQ